ncbi:MAG TPA: exodeoxyribonuclease VII small subunit [Anaerovoracaceae bacterium]|nr:exodeoxyribonuclease VII small subunit [Anaerovoracaceae bacterium]
MAKKTLSFEDALEGLENSLEALKSKNTTLDDALAQFEAGMMYYEKCKEHLTSANKKIQIYDKVRSELTSFNE